MLCEFHCLYYTAWSVCCATFTRVHFGNLVNVYNNANSEGDDAFMLALPFTGLKMRCTQPCSQKRCENMREEQERQTLDICKRTKIVINAASF